MQLIYALPMRCLWLPLCWAACSIGCAPSPQTWPEESYLEPQLIEVKEPTSRFEEPEYDQQWQVSKVRVAPRLSMSVEARKHHKSGDWSLDANFLTTDSRFDLTYANVNLLIDGEKEKWLQAEPFSPHMWFYSRLDVDSLYRITAAKSVEFRVAEHEAMSAGDPYAVEFQLSDKHMFALRELLAKVRQNSVSREARSSE